MDHDLRSGMTQMYDTLASVHFLSER